MLRLTEALAYTSSPNSLRQKEKASQSLIKNKKLRGSDSRAIAYTCAFTERAIAFEVPKKNKKDVA
jgi:hypothetical protein